MMKLFIAVVLQTLFFSAAILQAQSSTIRLPVSANTDIYRAEGYNDGSGGVEPFPYVFPAQSGQILEFEGVVGYWTCATGVVTPYVPDGTTEVNDCYPRASIKQPVGPYSGFYNTDFHGAMVGMFLEYTPPASAPAPLRFYFHDSSQGGIQVDFKTLSPLIGQVFFIGDGLTGTEMGVAQIFVVPPTATHLFLGYVDSCSQSGYTAPSCYQDNAGAVIAVFHMTNTSN